MFTLFIMCSKFFPISVTTNGAKYSDTVIISVAKRAKEKEKNPYILLFSNLKLFNYISVSILLALSAKSESG